MLELDGLLPKLYCERGKCIVTRDPFGEWIVLQRRLVGLGTLLQYTKVYYKLAGLVWAGCVLQYTKCIVTEREEAVENCIAIQLLYCG